MMLPIAPRSEPAPPRSRAAVSIAVGRELVSSPAVVAGVVAGVCAGVVGGVVAGVVGASVTGTVVGTVGVRAVVVAVPVSAVLVGLAAIRDVRRSLRSRRG